MVYDLKKMKVPNPSEKYQVFNIQPKAYTKSLNQDLSEERQVIYESANLLNDKLKYFNFSHMKNTKTDNVNVVLFQNQLKDELDQIKAQNVNDERQLEMIRKFLVEEKYYAALFQLFQIKSEKYFTIGIQFFEQMKLKKFTQVLREIVRERGQMLSLDHNQSAPMAPSKPSKTSKRKNKLAEYEIQE